MCSPPAVATLCTRSASGTVAPLTTGAPVRDVVETGGALSTKLPSGVFSGVETLEAATLVPAAAAGNAALRISVVPALPGAGAGATRTRWAGAASAPAPGEPGEAGSGKVRRVVSSSCHAAGVPLADQEAGGRAQAPGVGVSARAGAAPWGRPGVPPRAGPASPDGALDMRSTRGADRWGTGERGLTAPGPPASAAHTGKAGGWGAPGEVGVDSEPDSGPPVGAPAQLLAGDSGRPGEAKARAGRGVGTLLELALRCSTGALGCRTSVALARL